MPKLREMWDDVERRSHVVAARADDEARAVLRRMDELANRNAGRGGAAT